MTPLDALQRTLAGEHAAAYVFSVLAAQAPSGSAAFRRLDGGYRIHLRLREELTAKVAAFGVRPVAADPAYRLPNPARTPAQLDAAARVVEERLLLVYGELVAATVGADRSWSISVLGSTAVRLLEYGGSPSDLPGWG